MNEPNDIPQINNSQQFAGILEINGYPMQTVHTGQLTKALSLAKAKFPPIKKNSTVTVQTRNGGKYVFKYADLSNIISTIDEYLSEKELAVTHSMLPNSNDKIIMRTTLSHSSNEFISCYTDVSVFLDVTDLKLPDKKRKDNNIQEYGSIITYMRRYGMSCILGISTDDDVDANDLESKSFKIKNTNNNEQLLRKHLNEELSKIADMKDPSLIEERYKNMTKDELELIGDKLESSKNLYIQKAIYLQTLSGDKK